jgi:hypothetical protein
MSGEFDPYCQHYWKMLVLDSLSHTETSCYYQRTYRSIVRRTLCVYEHQAYIHCKPLKYLAQDEIVLSFAAYKKCQQLDILLYNSGL